MKNIFLIYVTIHYHKIKYAIVMQDMYI